MLTRGDVSLDVEDNRGPNDWPQISDMTADVIKYSVHFPLIPKVCHLTLFAGCCFRNVRSFHNSHALQTISEEHGLPV